MIFRSEPRRIFSSDCAKSAELTSLRSEPRREERGLVDEVREIRSDHAGRRRGDPLEVDVRRERHVSRVHLEDQAPPLAVGRQHGDATVEAPGTQQRLVEYVDAVRRPDHDHCRRRVEAVHLGEDLVQRLLALVAAAAVATGAAAGAADGVELVDEDDRGRILLGLTEQVADTGSADADDRLDELRRRHREERRARLAGDGARE